MDTASQQRILGYFIEEAKEHLQTLEQGILKLSKSSQDKEMVNEMFRAAHSVKGGAAMLGYSSIQKTAHRLEDSFKILKEHPINVDPKLESLFLTGYDHLQDLIDRLESSTEFNDEEALGTLKEAESNYVILQDYFNKLISSNGNSSSPSIAEQVTNNLKQMLALFKQPDSNENRKKLQAVCINMAQIAPKDDKWQNFIKTTQLAVTNKKYPYKTIAQIIIKEVKQAGDNLNKGNSKAIVPSKNLKTLAAQALASGKKEGAKGQITIARDPKAAAIALLKNFNKKELSYIVKLVASKL